MDRIYYPVGTRVVVTEKYDGAREGMIGTVCVECLSGRQGIVFDNEFNGGHTLGGKCKDGYGHWVSPEKLAALYSDETSISCDEEVRFY